MIGRLVMFAVGLPLAFTGFGLVVAFGVLAFIGMPLLFIGLGLISAAVSPDA